MREEIKRLTEENVNWRMWNTRRVRRQKWMQKPESIDMEAVSLANHILGVPPSLIAALIYTENGPKFLETGSIDKTDWFAKSFALKDLSTLDGTRTLNRLVWDWLLNAPPDVQQSFFMSAAKPYTALSLKEQQTWARNMRITEKRFRAEIKLEADKPVLQPLRTRTP